jgi:DNA-binding response OmpR family regulator
MAGKKILIVEDENLQLTTLAKRLKSAGFEVAAARDGTSAISTARIEQPDVILLDLACLLETALSSRRDCNSLFRRPRFR